MTRSDPPNVAEIDFRYDQKYRNRVRNESDPDQWVEVSVRVGDEDVYGGSRSIVTGHACLVVLDLLDSVEALHHNEWSIVEFDYGPSWLAIRSVDETIAEIAACHTLKGAKNPGKRLDAAREYYVTKCAWVDAVVELAYGFHDAIIEIDPDLSNHEVMEEIQQRRQKIERIIES